MGRYHVSVKYDRPPVLPTIGPTPPQYVRDAFASMTVCRQGDTGTTTVSLTVTADDEASARAEGARLAGLWAAFLSIAIDGEVTRVVEALELVGAPA
jgi:hypothetical protein